MSGDTRKVCVEWVEKRTRYVEVPISAHLEDVDDLVCQHISQSIDDVCVVNDVYWRFVSG